MRKFVAVAALLAGTALIAGCGKRGYDRDRPDEFAVARQAPLVIPPDYALVPPQPGAAPTQGQNVQEQTLDALFGGAAARSASESAAVRAAGGANVASGIRSSVGDPDTTVIDKGSVTRDIVAAPEGDGAEARTSTPR